jgi:hypothetical protein
MVKNTVDINREIDIGIVFGNYINFFTAHFAEKIAILQV